MEISCIMSNYNTPAEYLHASIQSILSQTMGDFELIIIDDGSTDASLEIIKDYAQKDSRIVLVENGKNCGLPYSLNRGIDKAQGRYIARMDTDDISLPDRFRLQKEYLDSHSDIDVLGGFALCFGKQKGYSITPFYDFEHCKCAMLYASSLPHPTVMMRRDFLQNNSLRYNETFRSAQDLELWSRCLEYGKVEVLDSVLLLYRIHGNQISVGKREQQKQFVKQVCQRQISNHIKKNVTDEELELHLILSGYNKMDENNAIQLFRWVEQVIKSSDNYYNGKALKDIMNLRFYMLLVKSNINLFMKLKICFLQRSILNLNFLKYYIYRKRVIKKLSIPEKYRQEIYMKTGE
ncbi:MAG: glycosyltransferase [Lachnospiraceae bacterium]|nr:glycosyltransferase [Lachnospiraceae bacterium]